MSLRRVYVAMDETETPSDLRDGERVEAIRLGGPRDGDRIGIYVVRLIEDGVELRPEPSEPER